MNKNEYLLSRAGELHSVIVDTQPTTSVIGSIRGDNLRNIVSILAGGLQDRLNNAENSPVKTALQVAFKFLSLPEYAINLGVAENMNLLLAATQYGIITESECNEFVKLATYTSPVYNISREDFYTTWHELPETTARYLTFRLANRPLENTYILFYMQDVYEDSTTSEWYYATTLHNVNLVKEYVVPVPYNGHARRIKWCCEYPLNCKIY